MKTLSNIRIENIGGNKNEFRIFFTIDYDNKESQDESFAVYKGEQITSVVCTLLEFLKVLI